MNGKSVKRMLLGISVMLLGLYMTVVQGIDQALHGFEFYAFFIGLIVVVVGFFTFDRD